MDDIRTEVQDWRAPGVNASELGNLRSEPAAEASSSASTKFELLGGSQNRCSVYDTVSEDNGQ